MPRKPSMLVTFEGYPPLPTRSWSKAIVQDVCRAGRDTIRINFAILDEPRQAGRKIQHNMPTILAPGSPLFEFLNGGFGIEFSESAPFDLTTLVGRVVEVRFSSTCKGAEQNVAAVRRFEETTRVSLRATAAAPTSEKNNGLEQNNRHGG